MALSGVDLVVELPTIASLSSSDYFATFAIKALMIAIAISALDCILDCWA
jgi:predicted nucleotidyltransferase